MSVIERTSVKISIAGAVTEYSDCEMCFFAREGQGNGATLSRTPIYFPPIGYILPSGGKQENRKGKQNMEMEKVSKSNKAIAQSSICSIFSPMQL